MKDIFQAWRHFDEKRGIHLGQGIRDSFAEALHSLPRGSQLSALAGEARSELKAAVDNLAERLDALGFLQVVLAGELTLYKQFAAREYSPRRMRRRHPQMGRTDFVATTVDCRTVRYSLEAFLFIAASLVEFLALATGRLYGMRQVRRTASLLKALARHRRPWAVEQRALLREFLPLLHEIEKNEPRVLFVHVDAQGASPGASLRDIAAHSGALRLNPLQIEVAAFGVYRRDALLEPGVWSQAGPSSSSMWGEGRGVTQSVRALRDRLGALMRRWLDTICRER